MYFHRQGGYTERRAHKHSHEPKHPNGDGGLSQLASELALAFLAERPTPGRRCILVVDDNRDAAANLAMMLAIQGNETRTAHDGLAALEVGAAFLPDAVLLDIEMPKLNGYDTARRIRQESWGRNVTLVALTGWGQEEDRRRSREAGFDHHAVKPVEPAALEQLLGGAQPVTA